MFITCVFLKFKNLYAMKLLTILFLSLIAESCTDSGFQRYEKIEKSELTSGRHVDSLFFGFYFGMTNKDFFHYCCQHNKKGIFEGQNNKYVSYKLKNNELQHPASMNFYPDFYKGNQLQTNKRSEC